MWLAPGTLSLGSMAVMLITTGMVVGAANALNCYLERDSERLRALTERELERMGPSIRERFEAEGIVARNRRMADRAAPLFDQGGTLVAVGALHLSGEHGLVELLRARGYRVEPIY